MTLPNIKYLINESGERMAVVIDIQDWQILQEELERLKEQEEIKGQIRRGLDDVKMWKNGEKELTSLEDFLKHEG